MVPAITSVAARDAQIPGASMHLNRALLVSLAAVVLMSGCRTRESKSVSGDELRAENARLTSEVTTLSNENDSLRRQLDDARSKLKDQGDVGGKIKDILASGEIDGVYSVGDGRVAMGEDFVFAKGSADLSPDGEKVIKQLAARLNTGENSGSRVVVEGHTDDTPVSRKTTLDKYTDNWGLSAARAATVCRALQSSGVDAKRIFGSFRGEHSPRDASDKAKNRRVELYLK
jgi:flagellar motor protein MotB